MQKPDKSWTRTCAPSTSQLNPVITEDLLDPASKALGNMESRIEQQLSQLAEPHKKILEPIREDVALTLEILLGNSVIGLKKVVEYATTNPGTPWPRLEVYKNIADKITEELPEQMKDYLPDDRKTKESVKQLSENPETVAKLKEIFQQNVEYVMDSMRTAHMQEQGKNQGAQSR